MLILLLRLFSLAVGILIGTSLCCYQLSLKYLGVIIDTVQMKYFAPVYKLNYLEETIRNVIFMYDKRKFCKAVFGKVLDKVLKETSNKALEENKIKLIDRNNSGLYSIEVSKCDNDNDARENIRQKLFQQIESEIDEKVYKWMEPKQTKFKYYEKDKIEQFNMELIQFLNCLRDTSKFPTTFREQSEFSIIGEKIHHILKTMKSFIR